jgi:hypothetical protein
MDDVGEVRMAPLGKHPAQGAAWTVRPHQQAPDGRVEAAVVGKLPAEPAGMVHGRLMANGGVVGGHERRS